MQSYDICLLNRHIFDNDEVYFTVCEGIGKETFLNYKLICHSRTDVKYVDKRKCIIVRYIALRIIFCKQRI